MSFTTSPKDGGNSNQPPANRPASPRERAIAAFNAAAQQGAAQTQAPPAEVLMAQAAENTSKPAEESRQENISEAPNTTQESVTQEKPLSPQYAALARKEKALRAQAQQFKQEQMAFKQQQDEFKSRQAEIDKKLSQLDRLEKDPWSVLQEKNISYDQITAQALSTPEETAIARLEARIKAQDEAIERQRKAGEDAQSQQYQQAVDQIRYETKTLVAKDPAYEMVKATHSVGDVVELIEKTFKEDQVLLTVEEAAQMVEEHLVEEALKLAKLGKIQRKLTATSQRQSPQKQQGTPQGSSQQSAKTLTNAVGTTRKLSARERAVLAFEGKLK